MHSHNIVTRCPRTRKYTYFYMKYKHCTYSPASCRVRSLRTASSPRPFRSTEPNGGAVIVLLFGLINRWSHTPLPQLSPPRTITQRILASDLWPNSVACLWNRSNANETRSAYRLKHRLTILIHFRYSPRSRSRHNDLNNVDDDADDKNNNNYYDNNERCRFPKCSPASPMYTYILYR